MDGETKFIQNAIRRRQAHFLGTDMHRMDRRPPVLRQAIRWIERHAPDQTEALFTANVRKLIEDKEIG
jgi:protein-tyrosine phosphatase